MNINLSAVLLATLVFAALARTIYHHSHRAQKLPSNNSKLAKLNEHKGLTISASLVCGALLAIGLAQTTHLANQVSNIPWFLLSLLTAFVVWLSFISVSTFMSSASIGTSKWHILQRMVGSLGMLLLMAVPIGLLP